MTLMWPTCLKQPKGTSTIVSFTGRMPHYYAPDPHVWIVKWGWQTFFFTLEFYESCGVSFVKRKSCAWDLTLSGCASTTPNPEENRTLTSLHTVSCPDGVSRVFGRFDCRMWMKYYSPHRVDEVFTLPATKGPDFVLQWMFLSVSMGCLAERAAKESSLKFLWKRMIFATEVGINANFGGIDAGQHSPYYVPPPCHKSEITVTKYVQSMYTCRSVVTTLGSTRQLQTFCNRCLGKVLGTCTFVFRNCNYPCT